MTAHVHAKEMLLYAKDSAQSKMAWKKWQKLEEDAEDWVCLDGHPLWNEKTQYRRAPKTVTINGVELADTRITQMLQTGEIYFVEAVTEKAFFDEVSYDGTLWDDRVISRGVAHSTKEGAAAFCRARHSLSAKA